MEELRDLLSYGTFLRDRQNFIRSGGKHDGGDNRYDSPASFYFKIFFHFKNCDTTVPGSKSVGLLAPAWDEISSNWKDRPEVLYESTSAWTYLMMNGEYERASLLRQFIELLSSISSDSPWYFTSVTGLDTALTRAMIDEESPKVSERKTLSIKCLPDSYDNRIGTLMDLYRGVVWSWNTKRVILPANLRKFDMSIYIFSDPIKNIHSRLSLDEDGKYQSSDYSTLNIKSSSQPTSYKYLEFHNCEINYNSAKSLYTELNNTTGFTSEPTIEIYYDDVFENRYNEFYDSMIGDFVAIDSALFSIDEDTVSEDIYKKSTIDYIRQSDIAYSTLQEELDNRSNIYNNVGETISSTEVDKKSTRPNIKSISSNILKEVGGHIERQASTMINKLLLGNMHTLSLSKLSMQVEQLMKGKVFTTIKNIRDYTTTPIKDVLGQPIKSTTEYVGDTIEDINNFFTPPTIDTWRLTEIKNMHTANTIKNNL